MPTQPKSIKSFLRSSGIPLGGAVRAQLSRMLDDALLHMWENACEMYGGETAALILFSVMARDLSYPVPFWLAARFRAHRAAIVDAVASGTVSLVLERFENPKEPTQ